MTVVAARASLSVFTIRERDTLAHNTKWPEGLSDEDAVMRLQTVLIQACEGNRDLTNDRDYKALRSPVIGRADWSDVVPTFVRAHRDLASFWAYIKQFSGQWAPRRDHVWESFKPLFDRVEGRSKPPVRTSSWTGRRTVAEQAQIVLALAPDALHGVEWLLGEQEKGLDNGGPVDDERADAIASLKKLRQELEELIDLAESGQPLSDKLGRISELKASALRWIVNPYGLALGNLPLAGQTAVIACGVSTFVNAITKDAVFGNTVGTVAATAYGAATIAQRKNSDDKNT